MKKLELEDEVKLLLYIQNHKGRIIKGETRNYLYEIYGILFTDGRDSSVCSCLDRDTDQKVNRWIKDYQWSDEIRRTERFKSILPEMWLEPEPIEEVSTQPIDMSDVLKSLNKSKRKRK